MEIVTNQHPGFVVMQKGDAEVQCEVLFTFEDAATGNTIVAFTDRSLDSRGNVRVYAALQQGDSLVPIRTKDEEALVLEVLRAMNSCIPDA